MLQEEQGLFQVRINEQGKKFIRRFAAISYTMMVLVFFESAISIYWSIKMLVTVVPLSDNSMYQDSLYDKIYPYLSILFSSLAIISNFYYLRFPQILLRSIEINDEFGANQAFRLLFRGAIIFLFWLLLITASMIWTLIIR